MKNIDISFVVSEKWILYFRKILWVKHSTVKCLKDAQILKEKIMQDRNENKSICHWVLEKYLWNNALKVEVEVFPTYFILWACNTEYNKIIIWQEERCKGYYSWIITHELVHIWLKNKKLNRLIEEIICFRVERESLLNICNIELKSLVYTKMSNIHKKAIDYVYTLWNDLNDVSIDNLIDYLEYNISGEEKKMHITNNLLKYLRENE